MDSRLYTNVMLTVNAFTFVIMTFRDMSVFTGLKASKINYASPLPLNEDGSLNVRLSDLEEIDVNISGISTFEELDVKIKDVEGGPLRVELED